MMEALVTGVGLWTPGFPSPDRWADKRRDPEATQPPCALLSSRAKRGTSMMTRMAVEVAEQAAARGGRDIARTATVFGSALGEVQTAIDQMAMIESDDGRLSPTRFKNSVHNTAPGLLSIAVENRGFSTALAAGKATVAMTFVEGMALLGDETDAVIVSISDEALPPPFGGARGYESLAVAFCLCRDAEGRPLLGRVAGPVRRGPGSGPPLPEQLRRNPAACALPLVDALLSRRSGTVPLELGDGSRLCVELDCEVAR